MGQVYDLLEDDGIFVLQVAGIRPTWQYEDLIWFVPSSALLHLLASEVGDKATNLPLTIFYSSFFIFRGLFMNKYVFPGADASCALNWVIGQVEGVGFEVKSIDVLGVHCASYFLSLRHFLMRSSC